MEEVKAYKSKDGKIFFYEDDCIDYEQSLKQNREYWKDEIAAQNWFCREEGDLNEAYEWIIKNTKGFKQCEV